MEIFQAAKKTAIAFALSWAGTAALAQPATTAGQQAAVQTETVTVPGTRSRQAIQDFTASLAAPTQVIGKIARWETGICPITVGVLPDANRFVTERVKEIAARIGAPISTDKACKPNIEIVFTPTAQALLDTVKKKREEFLGYHDSPAQRDRLATVTHPIQAWYTTATQDLNGFTQVDASMAPGAGPDAIWYNSSGFRLRNGLRSDFFNILIVADPSKLESQTLDAVSDYIAMLALTQPASLTCPPLSSIIGLLAKDCGSRADRLTDSDLSYLQGAYRMNPEMSLVVQQRQIMNQMEQALSRK